MSLSLPPFSTPSSSPTTSPSTTTTTSTSTTQTSLPSISSPSPSSSSPPATTSSLPPTSTPLSSSPTSLSSSTSSSLPPLISESTSIFISDGQTLTITTVVEQSPTTLPTPTTTRNTSSTSFFHNTGEVAGVFTVVGLAVIVVVIWAITSAIRRRRAKKFDADVAAAAAEAAASSRRPDFDDYDYNSTHAAGGGVYGYSDNSHGTFSQPPLSHEAYGMSELGGTAYQNLGGGSGPTSDYDRYPVAPGAAGIGAGGIFRSKSTGPATDPYGAFAAPQDPPQQHPRYRTPVAQDQFDWADAGSGGYGLARGLSQSQQQQQQPPVPSSLARNRSQGANTIMTQSSHSHYANSDPNPHQPPPESYAAHYKQGFNSSSNQPQVRPTSVPPADDVYGGVAENPSPFVDDEFPNPFARSTGGDRPVSGTTDDSFDHYQAPGFTRDDARMSLGDDEDYGVGKRVLKVANE